MYEAAVLALAIVMLPAVSFLENEYGNTAMKLLSAMRRNALDWQISQLQTVAKQHGIDWRHDGRSHCVFVRLDGKTLPVPAHRPIKPIYVKKFLSISSMEHEHEQAERLPI